MLGLCCSRRNEVQGSAFVKSPNLRWVVGDLRFKRSLPSHDYIHRLVEHFRKSSSPECMRRVVFSPDKILCEYASASFHLPGAYAAFFPCPHCTYKDQEGRSFFVEVFHFPNAHDPSVCATVTFAMRADSRVVLHIDTDVFIEVLRFLPRSELEKLLLVSRWWSNVVKGSEGSLQQRHCFALMPKFYVESPGMLSLYFFRTHLDQWRILRVLTTRGLSQALNAVHSHMRNAFVEGVFPDFSNRVPTPRPPRKMLVDVPLSRAIDRLKSLLRSMPLNSEIGAWCVVDYATEFDTLPTLANCASEAHRKLECVQKLEVGLYNRGATWAQLSSLLSQPSIREFREISVATTRVAMDTSGLRAILPSLQSLKLHLFVSSVVDPQDTLLTLPRQIILDFMALRDVNNFTAEFSLHIKKPDNIAFAEMPDVFGTADRRRRFRYHHKGEDTVVRVSVYENPAVRGHLSVVTFDHFRRNVVFLNGNMSVAELKQVFHRPYDLY